MTKHKEEKPHTGGGGRKSLLTPEVQGLIVAALEKGAFEIGAARAAGISDRTFRTWMERGEKARAGDEMYAEFYLACTQAKAKARITAEQSVFLLDPFKWLRYGPGRERPGSPGWGENIEVSGPAGGDIPLSIKTVWGRAERTATQAKRAAPPPPPTDEETEEREEKTQP